MPAWASDPLPRLWKGALSGAFLALAAPAWAEVDLNGMWQNMQLGAPLCQATAETFTDKDGVLTIALPGGEEVWPPAMDMSWSHGAWKDGRLDLTPVSMTELPMWAEESMGGLNLCRIEGGVRVCAPYRRCEDKS